VARRYAKKGELFNVLVSCEYRKVLLVDRRFHCESENKRVVRP